MAAPPTFSDDELTALALAADPDAPVPDDAVSLWEAAGLGQGTLLPGWYMPTPVAGRRAVSWRRRVVVMVVIAAFVAIDAYGLCSTYGEIVLA